jgi:hypothetical protein
MLGAEGVTARPTRSADVTAARGISIFSTLQATRRLVRKSRAMARRSASGPFFMVVVPCWIDGVKVSMLKV